MWGSMRLRLSIVQKSQRDPIWGWEAGGRIIWELTCGKGVSIVQAHPLCPTTAGTCNPSPPHSCNTFQRHHMSMLQMLCVLYNVRSMMFSYIITTPCSFTNVRCNMQFMQFASKRCLLHNLQIKCGSYFWVSCPLPRIDHSCFRSAIITFKADTNCVSVILFRLV